MKLLQSELRISVFPPDGDFVGLWISASNGRFAGGCVAYTSFNNLSVFASRLVGFPKKLEQRETWTNGVDKTSSLGYASLDFYCYDRTGHAAVLVKLGVDTATEFRAEEKDQVELEMKFEPQAIDTFVNQLQKALQERQGTAVLQGLISNTSGSGHYVKSRNNWVNLTEPIT